jgi:methyltransferase (TIGR00027 family)
MAEIAAVGGRVFEVDLEAQLTRKRSILAEGGIVLPSSIAHVACDFMTPDYEASLATRLADAGFRADAGTIYVWEGVVAYLDAPAIDRTLRFMGKTGGPGTRVAFDFAPMLFDPDPASAHTSRAGFSRHEEVSYDVLWRRHLASPVYEHAAGFAVAMAYR